MSYLDLVFISDTHQQHRDIPAIDPCFALIHTGDATNRGQMTHMEDFLDWMAQQPACYKIFVPGNHDYQAFKKHDSKVRAMCSSRGIQVLVNEGFTIPKPEISFWGAPLFGETLCTDIPYSVDILLTHQPAFQMLDKVDRAPREDEDPSGHIGSKELAEKLKTSGYYIHAHGHIHESRGTKLTSWSRRSINSCMVDRGDKATGRLPYLRNMPITVSLEYDQNTNTLNLDDIYTVAPPPFR